MTSPLLISFIIALMRFRPSFVLDPNLLSLQKRNGRDVALVVATVVMVPAQADHARGVIAGREVKITPVNVGKCRCPGQRRHSGYDAGFDGYPSA
jgi:hypothetical protein